MRHRCQTCYFKTFDVCRYHLIGLIAKHPGKCGFYFETLKGTLLYPDFEQAKAIRRYYKENKTFIELRKILMTDAAYPFDKTTQYRRNNANKDHRRRT